MTNHPRPHVAGLVAVVLTAAAGFVGLSSAPAAAAFCSGGGVNVVVDFNGLGGGVHKSCDPNGAGRTANKVFPAAGFSLTYAQRQPGFVCRVNGSPSSDPCQNTSPSNAYWGLFWSDGKSGKWSYSSTGAGGLKVPSGGFVAFSWQGSQAKDPPSASPTNRQSSPSPKPAPSKSPPPNAGGGGGTQHNGHHGGTTSTSGQGTQPSRSAGPTGAPHTRAGAARATTSASGAPTRSRSPRPSAGVSPTASASASSTPTASATASDENTPEATSIRKVDGSFRSQDQQGGLPTWMPVAVIVLIAGAAGGTLWWRRRTGTA